MTNPVNARFQFRHDTSANWTSVNPSLLQGEIGMEIDTGKAKFGDGVRQWQSLPYVCSCAPAINFSDAEIPSGGIDGENLIFILAHTPNPARSLKLFINGMLQAASGQDYTLAGNTITTTIPPSEESTMCAYYRY